jgi:hypothetical protein
MEEYVELRVDALKSLTVLLKPSDLRPLPHSRQVKLQLPGYLGTSMVRQAQGPPFDKLSDHPSTGSGTASSATK